MNKAIRFWNKMATRYDRQFDKKYKEAYRNTIELSRKYLDAHDTVLDFACGTGMTTIELARCAKKIIAIDFSEQMIDVLRMKISHAAINNVELLVADIFDSQFDAVQFDAIMAFNVLYFIDDLDRLLGRIHNLLSPGGIFISTTDCLAESMSMYTLFISFFSKLGVVPSFRKLKMIELENSIKKNGFKILEAHNLFPDPPNYFIAAKKE